MYSVKHKLVITIYSIFYDGVFRLMPYYFIDVKPVARYRQAASRFTWTNVNRVL